MAAWWWQMPNIQGLPRDSSSGALLVSGTGLTPAGILVPPDPAAASLNMRKGMARARNGGQAARVLIRGDSVSYGVLSGTNPGAAVRRDYIHYRRAQQLLSAGGHAVLPGRVESSIMQFGTADDDRFSYGGGATGGNLVGNTQSQVMALEAGYDTVDIVVLRSGGAVSIGVSGAEVVGTPLTFSFTVANNAAERFRIPMSSAAAHTFTITGPAAGNVTVLNIEPFVLATPPIIKLGGVGVSGQVLGVGGLNPNLTGSGTNMEKILRQQPDQLHLLMGINDMKGSPDYSIGSATFKNDVDAFVLACLAQGTDPVLWTQPSYLSAVSGPASAFESLLFHQAIYDVARNRNVWVVDLARRWGYGVNPTTGFASTPVTNSALYDGTHPTLLGYFDIGVLMMRFLLAMAG